MASEIKILFVNKTAASEKLSQSKGSERSRIFSHVQRKSISKQSTSQSPICHKDGLEQRSFASHKCRRAMNRSHSLQERAKPSPEDIDLMKSRSLSVDTTPQEILSHNGAFLLQQLGNILNPFANIDILVSPFATDLLERCEYFDSLERSPLAYGFGHGDLSGQRGNAIFPVKSLAVMGWQDTLSMAQQDPILMSAMLSTVSTGMHCTNDTGEHEYAAMIFKGHALQRLHKKLSGSLTSGVEVSSILAVSLLIWIECLRGDVHSLRAHMSGLQQMMLNATGVFEAPLPITTTIVESALLCAAHLQMAPPMRAPIVLCSDEVRPESTAAFCRHAKSQSKLGSRVLIIADQGRTHPVLVHVILAQREIMLWKDLFSQGKVYPTEEEITHVFSRQMAIDYSLVALPFYLESVLSPREQALRLAFFTFGRPITLVASSHAVFAKAMVSQMQKHLTQSDLSSLWGPLHTPELLWILFIVAHLARDDKIPWDWCMSYISAIIDDQAITSQHELEDALSEFYYFPEYFRQTVDLIWRDRCQKSNWPWWDDNEMLYP